MYMCNKSQISMFQKNNIYWPNTISSYFFKKGTHSNPLSMFGLVMKMSGPKTFQLIEHQSLGGVLAMEN